MRRPLVIGGQEIGLGVTQLELPLAQLYTHSDLQMPVHVHRGRTDGPVLFISAALHGDELVGVEILRRVLRHKALKRIRGTLIAVPVVNVHGFVSRSRYLPDRRDLNRSFPGSESGSLAARIAHTFAEEVVRKADFGIDLHTGAVHRSNFPQLRADLEQPGVKELAEAFGAPLILDSKPGAGTLRQVTRAAKIPVVVYEGGEALRFDETSIRVGVSGVLNVMRYLGMLPASKRKAQRAAVIAHGSGWVRAENSGILRTTVALGEKVDQGQVLGYIADTAGANEVILRAPGAGVVIGKLNLPLVYEGEAVYHVARTRRAEAVVEQWEMIRGEENPLEPALDEPPIL